MKTPFLEAAKITKAVGLKGEMRAQLLCDSEEILTDFDLFLGKEHTPIKAISAVPVKSANGDMCRLRLEGVETVEQAQKLTGKILYINREDAQLPEDTYFIADIIGLPVYDCETGELYGKVSEILQNAPTDVYVIKSPEGKELLFPAIADVLKKVDIKEERIEIKVIDGLFD